MESRKLSPSAFLQKGGGQKCSELDYSRTKARGVKSESNSETKCDNCNPKMYWHSKFGILTSNIIEEIFWTNYSRTEASGQGHSSDPETVYDSLQPKEVSTHQI